MVVTRSNPGITRESGELKVTVRLWIALMFSWGKSNQEEAFDPSQDSRGQPRMPESRRKERQDVWLLLKTDKSRRESSGILGLSSAPPITGGGGRHSPIETSHKEDCL